MERLKIFLLRLAGFRYVVNLGSGEIHVLKQGRCNVMAIKRRKYIRRIGNWIRRSRYNGCYHCLRKRRQL
ncbi:MAG: hypothetical protein LBR64_10795 [Dysgonamonadaceae bacterium]|jgi:hypothetical protein|nr:hypothetical protein [Dysgonamonadaceae bacterium]